MRTCATGLRCSPRRCCSGSAWACWPATSTSAALADIPTASIATANGVHQSLRYGLAAVGVAAAIAVLGGTHDVHLYNWMWLLLGILQALCIPLMWFGYPRGPSAAR